MFVGGGGAPLQALADSLDLAELSDVDFGRVPYVLLLVKVLGAWRAEVRPKPAAPASLPLTLVTGCMFAPPR